MGARVWIQRHFALIVVSTLPAGCAGGSGNDPSAHRQTVPEAASTARRLGYSNLVKLLDDGVVSRSDVEEGYQLFAQCIERHGGSITTPTWNPVDSVNYGSSTGRAGLSLDQLADLLNHCASIRSLIEGTYVATHTAHVDESIIGEMRDCLVQEGIRVTTAQKIDKAVENLPPNDPHVAAVELCKSKFESAD